MGGEYGRFGHRFPVETFGRVELDAVAVGPVVELDAVRLIHLEVDESE